MSAPAIVSKRFESVKRHAKTDSSEQVPLLEKAIRAWKYESQSILAEARRHGYFRDRRQRQRAKLRAAAQRRQAQ